MGQYSAQNFVKRGEGNVGYWIGWRLERMKEAYHSSIPLLACVGFTC